MFSYLSCADSATLSAFQEFQDEASPQVAAGSAGMIAVWAGDVMDPGVGRAGAGALVVGPRGPLAGPIGRGESVVFCHPVVRAPAVVRRDGSVQAGGWLPDHVRLGLLEEQLGEGVIEAVIAAAMAIGQVEKPKRRRAMSLELTARFVLAMVLAPDNDYRETMNALVGHLAAVPWARPWRIPSSRVFTTWRRRLGDRAMEELFVRHEVLVFRMEVKDRPLPCRRSGGVKLEAA